ncbi:MAG TPA: hypothetical protein VFO44_02490 [Steroidobacteraceae bacterium]|nr:hypothetical protein [Steroidobacteraceae bacterium]
MNGEAKCGGLSSRQAALVAGVAYLSPVAYAVFSIWPRLVVRGGKIHQPVPAQ